MIPESAAQELQRSISRHTFNINGKDVPGFWYKAEEVAAFLSKHSQALRDENARLKAGSFCTKCGYMNEGENLEPKIAALRDENERLNLVIAHSQFGADAAKMAGASREVAALRHELSEREVELAKVKAANQVLVQTSFDVLKERDGALAKLTAAEKNRDVWFSRAEAYRLAGEASELGAKTAEAALLSPVSTISGGRMAWQEFAKQCSEQTKAAEKALAEAFQKGYAAKADQNEKEADQAWRGYVDSALERARTAEAKLSEATAALSGRTVLSEEEAHALRCGEDIHGVMGSFHPQLAVLAALVRRLTNGDEKV